MNVSYGFQYPIRRLKFKFFTWPNLKFASHERHVRVLTISLVSGISYFWPLLPKFWVRYLVLNNSQRIKLQANPDEKLYKSEDSYGTSSLEHAVLSKSTDIVFAILDSYTHDFEKE